MIWNLSIIAEKWYWIFRNQLVQFWYSFLMLINILNEWRYILAEVFAILVLRVLLLIQISKERGRWQKKCFAILPRTHMSSNVWNQQDASSKMSMKKNSCNPSDLNFIENKLWMCFIFKKKTKIAIKIWTKKAVRATYRYFEYIYMYVCVRLIFHL